MRKLRPYHLAIAATAVATAGYAILHYQNRRLDEEAARLWQLLGLRPGARVAEVGAASGEIILKRKRRVGLSAMWRFSNQRRSIAAWRPIVVTRFTCAPYTITSRGRVR